MLYYTIKKIKSYSDNLIESKSKLEISEKKYKLAYTNANLYRDIFTHDVGNSLQKFLLLFEIIQEYIDPTKRQASIELYNSFHSQIYRGTELIKNVGILSRSELDSPSDSYVNIIKILNEVIEEIRRSFGKENVKINIKSENKDLPIKANKYLKYVFTNLINNGLIHNNNFSKEILINVMEVTNKDKLAKIEINDNGIGFSDDVRIFFEDLLNSKNEFNYRSGLGFFVVKRILSSLNGKISIKSELTVGTSITVMLPIKKE